MNTIGKPTDHTARKLRHSTAGHLAIEFNGPLVHVSQAADALFVPVPRKSTKRCMTFAGWYRLCRCHLRAIISVAQLWCHRPARRADRGRFELPTEVLRVLLFKKIPNFRAAMRRPVSTSLYSHNCRADSHATSMIPTDPLPPDTTTTNHNCSPITAKRSTICVRAIFQAPRSW